MALTMEKIVNGGKVVLGLQTFPIFCAYLLMIICSRWWKKVAPPLDLKPLMIVYNFTASAISLYTVWGFFYGVAQADSTFQRTAIPSMATVFHVYWLVKIFELLDTVFMIVRHKRRQISFLHVYHHSSMLLLSDLAVHYYPFPLLGLYLGLNSLVHVVLYLYYGLSALYPDNPPRWKKQLTQFQILQFVIDLVHASVGYMYHGFCVYGIFYGLTMVYLFSNFYYRAYVKVRSPKAVQNGTDTVQNGNGSVQNGNGSVQNGNGSVQNGTKSAQNGT